MMDVGVPMDGRAGSTDRSFEFGTSYHSPGFSRSRTSGAPSAPGHAATDMSVTRDAAATHVASPHLVVIQRSRSWEPGLTG